VIFMMVLFFFVVSLLLSATVSSSKNSFVQQSASNEIHLEPMMPDRPQVGGHFKKEAAVQFKREVNEMENGVETPTETESPLMLIRNARTRLSVVDLQAKIKQIYGIIQSYSGIISSSQLLGYSNTITVLVPSRSLDQFLEDIQSVALKVLDHSITSEDVNTEYYDILTRIKNLEAEHQSVLKIMEKAQTINDVLQVQRELSRITDDIEKKKGRRNFIEKRVARSEVVISLEENSAPIQFRFFDNIWDPMYTFKKFSRGLLEVLAVLGDLLIFFAVFSIPIGVTCCLGVQIYRRWLLRIFNAITARTENFVN